MTRADDRFDEAFARSLEDDKVDLQIQTGSVDALVERLKGVWPFQGPNVTPWGQRWIKLRDPDRLLIAVWESGS